MHIIEKVRLIGCAALVGLAGCSGIGWEHDTQKGLDRATTTRQRALLEFVDTFDADATDMDQTAFADKSIQALVKNFVPIRVNRLLNKALVEKYQIQKTPSFVVLRPDMSVSGKHEGTMTIEQLRAFLIRNSLK